MVYLDLAIYFYALILNFTNVKVLGPYTYLYWFYTYLFFVKFYVLIETFQMNL